MVKWHVKGNRNKKTVRFGVGWPELFRESGIEENVSCRFYYVSDLTFLIIPLY